MSRDDFDQVLNEELSALPSISSNDVRGKYDLIQEILKEINDADCHLSELRMNLRHAIEEYNAALAMSLRKRVPGLSVSLDGGRCNARYHSTALSCWPDLESGMWQFDGDRHGKSFSRRNAHLLPLSNQIDPLVDAIINYFDGRYRTINV